MAQSVPAGAPSAGGAGAHAEPCRGRQTYVRRQPEQSVLRAIVRDHLETFLAEARARGGGDGVPAFVERELREFLTCGVMASGFARFRCRDCAHEVLVAFSCKGRGFCPSCCGRRMAELAAHLVDGVLGGLPVRQWVLTLPHRLRYALAWDHRLCRAVLAVFVRAVLGFERRRGRRRGVSAGTGGAVTAIVARLLAAVRRRIIRLVARHGINLADPRNEVDTDDERRFECPAYAEIQGAAVLGRVATGPRAGARVMRVGADPSASPVPAGGALHAQSAGFDLHAAVAVPAGDRGRLEHLCRYVLRPPVAQDALELAPDGTILLRLRRAWRDGTRAIRFAPTELIEKLAAMVPKPRINLLVYHGAFAPNARGRRDAVQRAQEGAAAAANSRPSGGAGPGGAAAGCPSTESQPQAGMPAAPPVPEIAHGATTPAAAAPPRRGYTRPKYYSWADLLRRTLVHPINCRPRRGSVRAGPDHAPVSSTVRAGTRSRGAPAQLG